MIPDHYRRVPIDGLVYGDLTRSEVMHSGRAVWEADRWF